MVRTYKFTIGKAKVKLIGGWIAKKCWLTKLHNKMKLIVEACARVQLRDVTNCLSGLKSTVAPGDKKFNQSSSGEQHSGLDNDLMAGSDSDVDEADKDAGKTKVDGPIPLEDGASERERRIPRKRKSKVQRNKKAHFQVGEANNGQEGNGTKEERPRSTLADVAKQSFHVPDKGRQTHSCNWPNCNKCFSCKSTLVRHQRTHTGVKPFKCTWPNCGKAFSRSSDMTIHRRVHTGIKPFACNWPNCGKSFSSSTNRTIHRRIHTGEKPYVCNWPDCNKSFGQYGGLQAHKRTHTGERPFKCDFCDYQCEHGSALTRHIRSHTGAKPYKCCVCAVSFAESGNKNRHEKLHH